MPNESLNHLRYFTGMNDEEVVATVRDMIRLGVSQFAIARKSDGWAVSYPQAKRPPPKMLYNPHGDWPRDGGGPGQKNGPTP